MVVSRLDGIGIIDAEIADELGLSGFSARACGRPFDIRKGLPYGFYRHIDVELSLTSGGSVYSRILMAAHEAESALGLVWQQRPQIQDRHHNNMVAPLKSKQLALAAIEASSGQLIHAAVTNNTHEIRWYKINDATTTHIPAIEKALMGAFLMIAISLSKVLLDIMPLSRPKEASNHLSRYPQGGHCQNDDCETCINLCPTTAISKEESRLRIHYDRCIFCAGALIFARRKLLHGP